MAAAIGFYASAAIAVLAALAAMLARRREHALGGFAIASAAVMVPLIQLGASTVAAVLLLVVTVIVTLLGVMSRMIPAEPRRAGRRPIAYWLIAGLGLLGFAWVVFATGSRQVVDLGQPLARGSTFADGDALLVEFADTFVVPAMVIALLALAAVIAAVLGQLGSTREPEAG